MVISTSRNMTILGISTIVGAVSTVLIAIFDGDTLTNPDWAIAVTAVIAGVGMILGKGAASTGGSVDAGGKPVTPPPTP